MAGLDLAAFKTRPANVAMTFLALLMTLAALGAPSAPPIIHVGDPAMNGSAIQPYDNVWLVTLHYADGRVIERGLSTDHVRFIDCNGSSCLSRIEGEEDVIAVPGQQPSGRSSMTFNIFDPTTMAPRHGESYSSQGDALIRDFNGREVTTRSRSSAGATETTTKLVTGEAAFDFHGGMTGLLLAALPLASGFEARLPGVGDSDLDYTSIKVSGEESIAAGGLGIVKAWRVDIGSAPAQSTYWISKLPPYVIKVIVRGPRGYASWDMVR